MMRNDFRARGHAAWRAFLVHRISGLALAAFLPLHFWVLGTALSGPSALDAFLRFADNPAVRTAQWGLVVLLALHFTGGVRLLMIEFAPWTGLRKNWFAGAVGASVLVGLVYALALLA